MTSYFRGPCGQKYRKKDLFNHNSDRRLLDSLNEQDPVGLCTAYNQCDDPRPAVTRVIDVRKQRRKYVS